MEQPPSSVPNDTGKPAANDSNTGRAASAFQTDANGPSLVRQTTFAESDTVIGAPFRSGSLYPCVRMECGVPTPSFSLNTGNAVAINCDCCGACDMGMRRHHSR